MQKCSNCGIIKSLSLASGAGQKILLLQLLTTRVLEQHCRQTGSMTANQPSAERNGFSLRDDTTDEDLPDQFTVRDSICPVPKTFSSGMNEAEQHVFAIICGVCAWRFSGVMFFRFIMDFGVKHAPSIEHVETQ